MSSLLTRQIPTHRVQDNRENTTKAMPAIKFISIDSRELRFNPAHEESRNGRNKIHGRGKIVFFVMGTYLGTYLEGVWAHLAHFWKYDYLLIHQFTHLFQSLRTCRSGVRISSSAPVISGTCGNRRRCLFVWTHMGTSGMTFTAAVSCHAK